MKRRFLLLVVALFALICFVGCGSTKAKGDGEITLVVIDETGEELFNDELVYFTGDTLVDIFTKDEKVKMTGDIPPVIKLFFNRYCKTTTIPITISFKLILGIFFF